MHTLFVRLYFAESPIEIGQGQLIPEIWAVKGLQKMIGNKDYNFLCLAASQMNISDFWLTLLVLIQWRSHWGGKGAQSATPDIEKFANNRGKIGKTRMISNLKYKSPLLQWKHKRGYVCRDFPLSHWRLHLCLPFMLPCHNKKWQKKSFLNIYMGIFHPSEKNFSPQKFLIPTLLLRLNNIALTCVFSTKKGHREPRGTAGKVTKHHVYSLW